MIQDSLDSPPRPLPLFLNIQPSELVGFFSPHKTSSRSQSIWLNLCGFLEKHLLNWSSIKIDNWILTRHTSREGVALEIPVKGKMLNVSPTNAILIIQPCGRTRECYQPLDKVEFSSSHCSHVVSISLSLFEERGQMYTKIYVNWKLISWLWKLGR